MTTFVPQKISGQHSAGKSKEDSVSTRTKEEKKRSKAKRYCEITTILCLLFKLREGVNETTRRDNFDGFVIAKVRDCRISKYHKLFDILLFWYYRAFWYYHDVLIAQKGSGKLRSQIQSCKSCPPFQPQHAYNGESIRLLLPRNNLIDTSENILKITKRVRSLFILPRTCLAPIPPRASRFASRNVCLLIRKKNRLQAVYLLFCFF